jgi:hypothetical protein
MAEYALALRITLAVEQRSGITLARVREPAARSPRPPIPSRLPFVDPRAVRAFVNRDREAVDALKRAHWVRRFREGGPVAALDVAHALYEHARRVRPDCLATRNVRTISPIMSS